ncbi:anaphase-promoting complex subunit Apc2 [Schizosaccharomyces cryophilus OY26]|uniref:Anaphase-promoting complex subunit 2 n=1 Tax=Schizosaccharomyces cryophilus (strain OY26 / ATCC MYA-4695 / CBS 11777 / NBRC 106824 / NRRL Y48691) TaxID=653667 RepID=S9XAE1_SCHCR|nr:anaphase-promoting complex subunit Apc2 [Schizosaccharomyces cryophilus OY26]EPY54127.1 anaphase-promoting complex subunit Apc2 [Schizosaccharomyces cryophilus OY26]
MEYKSRSASISKVFQYFQPSQQESAQTLSESNLIDTLRTDFYSSIRTQLSENHPASIEELQNLIQNLYAFWFSYKDYVGKDPTIQLEHVQQCFWSLCRRHLPLDQIRKPLFAYLKKILSLWSENESNSYLGLEDFFHLCERLRQLGLASELKETFALSLKDHVQTLLYERYGSQWDYGVYQEAAEWIRSELTLLVEHVSFLSTASVHSQLDQLVSKLLGRLRSDSIFDIVLEYPRSSGAIEDLRLAARQPEQRQYLVERFMSTCEKSILRPSKDTSSILVFYVSTIRCFLALDPPGVLLDKAVKPIRTFLNERDDTSKSLVYLLFSKSKNGLSSELAKIPASNVDAASDRNDYLKWMPDPIDAAPDFRKPTDKDIIASLISIFKSKETLIKELQLLLADRLLQITDYNYDHESKNIGFLKYRFGESTLQMCNVMLEDIRKSKSIDEFIHGRKDVSPVFHATILSRIFWPNLVVRPFRVPKAIQEELNKYAASFSKKKNKRELVYLQNLGTVELEITLEDRTLDLSVTPEQATLISLFEESLTLRLEDAAEKLDQSVDIVKKHINFWVHHQVLTLVKDDVYGVRETQQEAAIVDTVIEDEPASAVQSQAEVAGSEMRVYWSFVVGMLTNLGSLELERIHNMLTMFIPPPNGYNRTQNELREFLALMVKEDKLEFTGGAYKLK